MDTRTKKEYISTLIFEFNEYYQKIHQEEFENFIEKIADKGLSTWLWGQNNPFIQKIINNLKQKMMLSASMIDDASHNLNITEPTWWQKIWTGLPSLFAVTTTQTVIDKSVKPKLILEEIINLLNEPNLSWEKGSAKVELLHEFINPLNGYDPNIILEPSDFQFIHSELILLLLKQTIQDMQAIQEAEMSELHVSFHDSEIASIEPVPIENKLMMASTASKTLLDNPDKPKLRTYNRWFGFNFENTQKEELPPISAEMRQRIKELEMKFEPSTLAVPSEKKQFCNTHQSKIGSRNSIFGEVAEKKMIASVDVETLTYQSAVKGKGKP